MPPKKQKTTHDAAGAPAATDLSILNPAIFDPDAIAASAAAYAAAEPYTHGVVTPLCDDARLRAVQQEMKENLTATFKETDLFKVLQTGDLVTIDQADPSVGEKIPELLKLRAAIYSPEFRDMVQRMTGCAPLTDRIDCSANVYPRSGHLLCHDDASAGDRSRTSSTSPTRTTGGRRGRRRARALPRGEPRHAAVNERTSPRVEQHGVFHRATRAKLSQRPGGVRRGQASTEHLRVVPRRRAPRGKRERHPLAASPTW